MAAFCKLRSDTVIILGSRSGLSVIQNSQRKLDVKVILRLRLPFSRGERFAHYKVIAKPEGLLKKVALDRLARAECALDAVGMRSLGMPAKLAALQCL